MIRRARENRAQKKHTAILMVDISAAFPTSKNDVREILRNADPNIAQWVDTWLDNRQISMELDGNPGTARDAGTALPQGSRIIWFNMR
jgi:hypothetical protein